MEAYEAFLDRMEKYRQIAGLSQQELSNLLDITQSQYSKLALGRVRVSFSVLSSLMDNNWDVDYLITGVKGDTEINASENEIVKLYKASDKNKRFGIIELLYWLITHTESENEYKDKFDWKYLTQKLQRQEEKRTIRLIRDSANLTQIDMTEILCVNIKKYRQIENGIQLPDADMMCRMYDKIGCRPAIILRPDDFSGIIASLWNILSEDKKKKYTDFIKQGIKITDW